MALEFSNETLAKVAKLPVALRDRAMGILAQAEFDRCAGDVKYWLDYKRHIKTAKHPEGLPYVYTMDPHTIYQCRECQTEVFGNKRGTHLTLSHHNTVSTTQEFEKRFKEMPALRPWTLHEYMPPIIDAWQEAQFFAIEKSRDMMATWLMVALFTWDALFHQGRQHIFQSQDANKTLELVTRSKIIYENHPKFLKDAIGPCVLGKGTSRSGEFFITKQHSEILGFPQGPDQIRQYHPSGLFQDEAAFQALAGEAFAAIKPAIQDGGKFSAISSANRSYFEHICRDKTSD